MNWPTGSVLTSMAYGGVVGGLALGVWPGFSLVPYAWAILLGVGPGALVGGSVEGLRRLYEAAFPDSRGRWNPVLGGFVGTVIGGLIGLAYGVACVAIWSFRLEPHPSKLAGLAVMIFLYLPLVSGLVAGLLSGLLAAMGPSGFPPEPARPRSRS